MYIKLKVGGVKFIFKFLIELWYKKLKINMRYYIILFILSSWFLVFLLIVSIKNEIVFLLRGVTGFLIINRKFILYGVFIFKFKYNYSMIVKSFFRFV